MVFNSLRVRFQSTLPIREETELGLTATPEETISIHSSHTGRDVGFDEKRDWAEFQSTLPIREETSTGRSPAQTAVHFNPLFPYGKRPARSAAARGPTNFNPLFPYGKRHYSIVSCSIRRNFNPLFPYGKRPFGDFCSGGNFDFNPLFPYGKRPLQQRQRRLPGLFQSTLPIREETPANAPVDAGPLISIHSSHTGRDSCSGQASWLLLHFNPLFPYGKRPTCHVLSGGQTSISIHSSHTGRDNSDLVCFPAQEISIHSSHTGRDVMVSDTLSLIAYFNPLFPYGKRRHGMRTSGRRGRFQSTLPIREETRPQGDSAFRRTISIHSSHTGRDIAW